MPFTPDEETAEIEELVVAALLSDDADEQREALVELNERLNSLPARLRAVVQEMSASAQGEARLTYAAKAPAGLVLSTPASPLQEWSNFGGETAPGEWRNKLIFGDNLGVLAALLRMKQRGELKNADGTDGIRLCYIDPPFATEREFTNSGGVTAYKDKVAGAEFVEFLRRRLILIRELLSDDGTLWVHLDTKKVHYVKVVLDEVFGESCFQSEVIWKRTRVRALRSLRRPGRIHDTILVYTRKADTWVWNQQFTAYEKEYTDKSYRFDDGDGRGKWRAAPLILSGQSTAERNSPWNGVSPGSGKFWAKTHSELDALQADGRLYWPKKGDGPPSQKLYLDEAKGVQVQDLWLDIMRVASPIYPTQKPDELLRRIIAISSNDGDLVLDCFSGSGTSLRVAESLGRRWVGVDCGKLAIHTATRDLLNTKGPDGESVKPFTVYHAGLYNPEELAEKLDAAAWNTFVLDLFGASHKSERRRGIQFHGRIGRSTLVHVVDPRPTSLFDAEAGHVEIGRNYLQSLIDAAKPGPRTKIAVIVPDTPAKKSTGLRQTTYKLRAASSTHDTEVRVLKVPPAITAEFLALDQPTNEKAVNSLIDAHGFNVAIPPDVTLDKTIIAGTPSVTIRAFESNSIVRNTRSNPTGEPAEDSRTDLAMVLIDYEHEPDRFDFEQVVYGDDLAKISWRLDLQAAAVETATALMLIDRFGNEARIVITPDEFGDAK